MSATLTNITHTNHALRFISDMDANEDYFYFFTGKLDPWEDENVPDTAVSGTEQIKDVKNSLIYFKRIQSADCLLGIKRYDWSSGKIYTQWSSDKDMHDEASWNSSTSPYYVIVDDVSSGTLQKNVYLCLNNAGGAPSAIQPSGTSTNSIVTSDGYTWKFVYRVSQDLYDFISDAFVPCPTNDDQKTTEQLNVEDAAIGGTIERIRIITGGNGYVNTDTVNIIGDGSDAVGALVVDSNGTITSVVMQDVGQDYTYAEITLNSLNGEGANLKAIISPENGLGYNASEDLNAAFVLIKSSLTNDEFTYYPADNNSYRRIGILKNPKDTLGELIIQDKFNLLDALDLNNISGDIPLVNTLIGTVSGAKALIFRKTPEGVNATAVVDVVNRVGEFTALETIYVEDSPEITGDLVTATYVDIDKDSPEILYYENVQYINRKVGQTEKFITPIEF